MQSLGAKGGSSRKLDDAAEGSLSPDVVGQGVGWWCEERRWCPDQSGWQRVLKEKKDGRMGESEGRAVG